MIKIVWVVGAQRPQVAGSTQTMGRGAHRPWKSDGGTQTTGGEAHRPWVGGRGHADHDAQQTLSIGFSQTLL